jgi:hypothetical protein
MRTAPRYGTFNLQAIGKAIAEIQAGMVHKNSSLPNAHGLGPQFRTPAWRTKTLGLNEKMIYVHIHRLGWPDTRSLTPSVCGHRPMFRDRQDDRSEKDSDRA